MALSAKLQLKQSQSLVMTPQLMQSIKLLQMNHIELDQFIETELSSNPFLERPENGAPSRGDGVVSVKEKDTTNSNLQLDSDMSVFSAESMAGAMDTSLENVFPDDPGSGDRLSPNLTDNWRSAGAGGGSNLAGIGAGEGYNLEDFAAEKPSLRAHITEQIALLGLTSADAFIAHELGDFVDETGYLYADFDSIAARLNIKRQQIEDVLAACHTIEPHGLFARNLQECLSLQLKALDRLDPAMQALLANLPLLAKRDFKALQKLCGVDQEDLIDMLDEIKRLEPKPGAAFHLDVMDAIVPDVQVTPAPDGSWHIELNEETLPKVLMNERYYATIHASASTKEDKDFIASSVQSAHWLVRSLDQRARTIMKVATEIVRLQDAFLVHGVSHLKPLGMKQVADAIKVHESTVSRVTTNKFMATPRGTFELRYFFTTAINAADGGDAHSSEAVRHKIRQLIDAESPKKVLSDDALVNELKAEGIDIARRTVAKYREAMNISSSVERRREKKAATGIR